MKNRIILDALIYAIAPILLCTFDNVNYLTYFTISLIILGIFYSIYIRYREVRINLSGIIFMSSCLLLLLLKKDIKSDFQLYVYFTYFLILCATLIPLLGMFSKNIWKQIYTDILIAKGKTKLGISNIIKKNTLDLEFNKLSSLFLIHLLIVSFVRVYSMSTYGQKDYLLTYDLEIVISVLFIIGEVYILSNIISKSKNEKSFKGNKDKKKYKMNDRRVININQYKNTNK